MRPAIRPVPFVGHVLVIPFTETGRRNRSARFIPASDILKLWTDTTTPRTDAPVRFMYSLSNAYTYRQAGNRVSGSGKAFLGYRA